MSYLAITDDKYFVNDKKILPFDNITNIRKILSDKWNKFEESVDKKSMDWYDEELDVSDLSPTLLFIAINNKYSTSFGLYIPLDMTIEMFAKKVIRDLNNKHHNSFNDSEYIDFDYLDKTGKIKSTKFWNMNVSRDGNILATNKCTMGTIQSIVNDCHEFQEQLLKTHNNY